MSPQLLRQSYLFIYIYISKYVCVKNIYIYQFIFIYICIYDLYIFTYIYIYIYIYAIVNLYINIYNHIYTFIYLDPRRHDLGFGVTSCNPSALGFDPLLLFTKIIHIYIYICIFYIFIYYYHYVLFYLKFKALILCFHNFNAI